MIDMSVGQILFVIVGVTGVYLIASLAFDAIGKWRAKHSKNSGDEPHGKEKK